VQTVYAIHKSVSAIKTCPHHKIRSDLPPLIPRIAALPVDERGYPVPFFVSWIDGKPEFRAADGAKYARCIREKLCWVCGQPLGTFKSFTIGPMCAITRTTAEPPSHRECAEWSVRGCPFLTKPKMVRRKDDEIEILAAQFPTAGIPIDRNPGVTAVWTTKSFKMFKDHKGGQLIEVGEPVSVTFWREGRTATRDEIMESIRTGLPALKEVCFGEKDLAALESSLKRAMLLLPA
jgi:hypothetical protein